LNQTTNQRARPLVHSNSGHPKGDEENFAEEAN